MDLSAMNSLELPRPAESRIFYLSSCESGTGIELRDSNVSSRRSSSSSSPFSTSVNIVSGASNLPIHTNSFLRVLKRLRALTLRRRKHGPYRTVPSALDLFFKKQCHHRSSSSNPFFKSPSTSALRTRSNEKSVGRHSPSCPQLHAVDSKASERHTGCNRGRSSMPFPRTRTSDKTVSEDNNTNTLSSLDLATVPSAPLAIAQQPTSIDFKRVSDAHETRSTWLHLAL